MHIGLNSTGLTGRYKRGASGPAISTMPLGLNIATPYTTDGVIQFSNLMWSSQGWELESETNAGTTSWTQSHGLLNVTAVTGTAVFRRILFDNGKTSIYDPMPSGTYTVKNPNGHNIGIGGFNSNGFLPFSTGTTDRTFSYSGGVASGMLALHVQVTATGTYGSGIKVLLPGHDGTDFFNAAFISYLNGLGSTGSGPLRFMQFMNTNDNVDTVWTDRTLTTDVASDPGCTPPWEIAFQLCNRVNRDCWICIPAQANSSYVSSLAALAFSTLNTGLKVWIERGNEIWNTAGPYYKGTQWITYKNHTRYAATVDSTTGIITRAAHGLTNGETILPFVTRTSLANGINADLASTNSNYYYAHRGATCTVSDVTTNTFRIKQQDNGVTGAYITFPPVNNSAYASASVTDILFVRVSDAGLVDLDVNYGNQVVADWAAFDTAFGGTTRVKAIMGTQAGTPGRSTTRLGVTGASRYNCLAGAPYFFGYTWIGAVDVASGQFTFKFWTEEAGTSTFYGGVYANGSTPLTTEVMTGTGTGFVAGSNKTITASFTGSAAYTSATASTGLVNGTPYTVCGVVKDSTGYIWRFPDITITASATTSTVDFKDSFANQNSRYLISMEETNTTGSMPTIDAQKAVIAASTNPSAQYILYECAGSNQNDELQMPTAMLTWLRSQKNDVGFRSIIQLYCSKVAAKLCATMCWYMDVSLGLDWKLADAYTDTTAQQYQAYASFGGVVPIRTPMSPSNVTASDINTSPTVPYVVASLPNDGTTYSVVSGTPGPDNYDFSGNNLRLVSNTGISYGTNVARTVKVRKIDGYTDKFLNVNFHTGPSNWYPTSSIFVFDSIADTDPAVMNAIIGTNGTNVTTPATVASNLWLNGTGSYNAATTGTVDLTATNLLFAAVINDNAQTSVNDPFIQISTLGAGSSLVALGTYFSSGPQTLDIRLASTGGTYDADFPAASKDGTTKVVWCLLDKPNSKVYFGYNQIEKNAGAGIAFPASMGTSINNFVGTLASNMKYGSIMAVAEAGMTLSTALSYIQAMQTHHGL